MRHCRLILTLLFAAALALGQLPKPGGSGAGGGGLPYVVTFSAVSSISLPATTHGQGVKPFLEGCWDNATPQNAIAMNAGFPTVAANGDMVITWTGSKTGYCLIGSSGASGVVVGTPNAAFTFAAAESLTVTGATHAHGHKNLGVVCYDSATNAAFGVNWTVNPSTYDVAVSWSGARSGYCVIDGWGGANSVTVAMRTRAFGITIDGGGSVITAGIKGDISAPYTCTINKARLLADQSGSAVINVWKDTYANYPPTNADSICNSGTCPTLASAAKAEDATLTSWLVAVTLGDTIRFNVDSATTVTRVTLILECLLP